MTNMKYSASKDWVVETIVKRNSSNVLRVSIDGNNSIQKWT